MREDAEPPRYELIISLGLSHDGPRDLGEMLRRWGYDVRVECRAGEPRRAPNGRELPGLEQKSRASTKLALPSSGYFEQVLGIILDRLEPRREELRAFVDAGGKAQLYASWFFDGNSGGTLNWLLSRRLADFGLDLALDIYPPASAEPLDSDTADEALA